MKQTDCIIISTTCADKQQAEEIAAHLLKKRLVACVQMQNIESHYHWKDKKVHDTEISLSMKTVAGHYSAVQAEITALHRYEVPQIIATPITHALPDYLLWIQEETSPSCT